MANPKLQSPRLAVWILLVAGTVLVLGAMAWGIGWAAHGLFDWRTARSAVTAEPSVPTQTATLATFPPTMSPSPSSVSPPTTTMMPTTTPVPTLAPRSTGEWETVQAGEGLYQVCRRHCAGRWHAYDVAPDLVAYAREIARLNGLLWIEPNGPPLALEQKLRMPSCP